ncbi:MAG TPA: c-type cytochrome biogenesis protein CcmI, partial [Burkholderiales bacterium]|nr:c-type cytochrome biogenesis protein CcmI [Burkholderiales bacterium]
MTGFWISGAALAAAALVLLLRPLLFSRKTGQVRRDEANISIYRDQLAELDADLAAGKLAPADHARSRAELEARLLADVAAPEAAEQRPAARRRGRRLMLALGAAVPLFAAALYLAVGNPASLRPGADPHAFDTQQLATLVEQLAAKMRENPDDPEGWRLLGRSYAALGRFPESLESYAKALARKPRDPDLLADMADTLAMTRGERLQGEPEKLVLRALEIDPEHLKSLALAGTAAFERKDYARAERYWRRMLPLVPAGSEDERQIRGSIDEARSLAGSTPPAGSAPRALQGKVLLSKKLAAQAAPDDVVFIL